MTSQRGPTERSVCLFGCSPQQSVTRREGDAQKRTRRWPGTKFKGIVFENTERPEIHEQLPNDGCDLQDHPLYWTFPCGRCDCLTLREFYFAKPDQLMAQGSLEAYREIASKLHFDVLGTLADEEQLVALREDLGTLSDETWRYLPWEMPPDEASPCWSQRKQRCI